MCLSGHAFRLYAGRYGGLDKRACQWNRRLSINVYLDVNIIITADREGWTLGRKFAFYR
jgi:hypothetical protein